MYKNFLKPFIDWILSLEAIIILVPLWIIIALAIFIDNPGSIFFVQERVGKNKKPFKMLKFRTMKKNAPHDMPTHLFTNSDEYITRVGRFLRKTSLDELPQLLNILTGKMAIIGPRPVLANEENLIAERDKYGANDIRPGLTGWAQINGRDELCDEVKARLDGEYVQKMSFGFDIKCFFKTIAVVFREDGVVEGGTEEKYKAKSAKKRERRARKRKGKEKAENIERAEMV